MRADKSGPFLFDWRAFHNFQAVKKKENNTNILNLFYSLSLSMFACMPDEQWTLENVLYYAWNVELASLIVYMIHVCTLQKTNSHW